jgi:sugar O-acyltransferase (sialic acid O-acetyltransferase NeuD family)
MIIFGTSDYAQLAHFYFSRFTDYRVVGFTVDSDYLPETGEAFGLPVIPFEEVETRCPPESHDMFVAVTYLKLAQVRRDKFLAAKDKGYRLASYVSEHATMLNDNAIGENCFIFEDNTVQPFVTIGDNVYLWSGNHIGHHSTIGAHSCVTSHVVVSGHVTIGERCFLGVNATLRDNITIGDECVIGAGAVIASDAEPGGVYVPAETERSRVPSRRLRSM